MAKELGGAGGLGNIMRQAQKQAQAMQKRLQSLEADLKDRVVEGSAGGGMVVAHANGQRELLAVRISPEVVDPDDVEMLEDLVVAAVAQAMKKAQELYQQEMQKLTGGLRIPGLF